MRYEYVWDLRPVGEFVTSQELSVWGEAGWRVVTVISRPGNPERTLLERVLDDPSPKGKGPKR